MFRYGTVSWTRKQQNPPIISFTVEAAFRRTYGSVDFRGSGPDGNLIEGDQFRPSGYQTILFDFGDSRILTPMLFKVVAYSAQEDWVQAVSTFEHQYPEITSLTWWKPDENGAFRTTVFKGCCRTSDLLGGTADTSWALSSVVNLLLDQSSPRLASLPVVTVPKKQSPADRDPSFILLADDNYPNTGTTIVPALPAAWSLTADIGAAGAAANASAVPRNLPNFIYDPATGRITLLAGPAFAAAGGARCADFTAGACRANATLPGLPAGRYTLVLQDSRAPPAAAGAGVPGGAAAAAAARGVNTTAPIEVTVSLVDESVSGPLPVVYSPEPGILFPAFTWARHVAYVGFPMAPFTVAARTAAHGVRVGFTAGRLPAGARLSAVRGGASAGGGRCAGGAAYCLETGRACNASAAGCACQPPADGAPCALNGTGGAPPAAQCPLGGRCAPCWDLAACPTAAAEMQVTWTPAGGQEYTHALCFDAVAQRDPALCAAAAAAAATGGGAAFNGTAAAACAPTAGPMECVVVDVLPNPPPAVWTSYAADVDPYAGTATAYLGRRLVFKVYANDSDCAAAAPGGGPPVVLSAGPLPPGAALGPQAVCADPAECPPPPPAQTVTYLGAAGNSTRACPTQRAEFRWDIPLTWGGYTGRHCFYATDSCGLDPACAGRRPVEVCVDLVVAKCQYAVGFESSLAEVASIFGSDWIQVWNLNPALVSPDHLLFRNQVLAIGRLYTVTVGDTLTGLARRFGTSVRGISVLNYELGAAGSTNLTIGQRLCLIANPCLGAVHSEFDQQPRADQALEAWYAGVTAAYERLRLDHAALVGLPP